MDSMSPPGWCSGLFGVEGDSGSHSVAQLVKISTETFAVDVCVLLCVQYKAVDT